MPALREGRSDMNDRMANLDFDVPKLPRKPRKPEPVKEPDAMTFGGMTIRKGEYVRLRSRSCRGGTARPIPRPVPTGETKDRCQ